MSERLKAVHDSIGWHLERWDAAGRTGIVCDHVWDTGEGAEVYANRIEYRYNAHQELAAQHARLREVLAALVQHTRALEREHYHVDWIGSDVLERADTALACLEFTSGVTM